MTSSYVYMHAYAIVMVYVVVIADMDYVVMWIVWGMLQGTH